MGLSKIKLRLKNTTVGPSAPPIIPMLPAWIFSKRIDDTQTEIANKRINERVIKKVILKALFIPLSPIAYGVILFTALL